MFASELMHDMAAVAVTLTVAMLVWYWIELRTPRANGEPETVTED